MCQDKRHPGSPLTTFHTFGVYVFLSQWATPALLRYGGGAGGARLIHIQVWVAQLARSSRFAYGLSSPGRRFFAHCRYGDDCRVPGAAPAIPLGFAAGRGHASQFRHRRSFIDWWDPAVAGHGFPAPWV